MDLTFYYDVVCPYAYLASTQVARVAERADATLHYQPMLLGGVFRAIGAPDAPPMAEAKAKMNRLDLARLAAWLGVPLNHPEDAHPRRTVLAMRTILAAGGQLVPATEALFRAYWVDGVDVADPEAVAAALDGAGLDGAALVERASTQEIKDALRKGTDAAVAAGVFGAPSFVVDGEVYWGVDRLGLVERALHGWKVGAA